MTFAGTFIAFEGGDGAGKSTQADLLAQWLRETLRREVVRTFEPGGTPLGQEIRGLLLHGDEIDARTEALLFAADRAHHVAQVIRPALQRGAIVVCDRYMDSSIAYQGSGRALTGAAVGELSRWATDGLLPDLTLLLDVAPNVGAARRTGKADRMERESLAFHTAVREAFLALAADAPERYLVLNAAEPVAQLQAAIQEAVSQRLAMVEP